MDFKPGFVPQDNVCLKKIIPKPQVQVCTYPSPAPASRIHGRAHLSFDLKSSPESCFVICVSAACGLWIVTLPGSPIQLIVLISSQREWLLCSPVKFVYFQILKII